ncbi:MAG: FG-GAP-like repeat-containing protein, partial [Phycisphaerae bacterium]
MRSLVGVLLVVALAVGVIVMFRMTGPAGVPGGGATGGASSGTTGGGTTSGGGAVDSNSYAHYANVGAAHYENRQSEPAIAAFQHAVALSPDNAAAHRNLARAFLLRSDAKNAQDALEPALKLNSDDVGTNYMMGLCHKKQTEFETARTYLQKAVTGDPDEPVLHFQLAIVEQALEKTESAISHVERVLELDPLHVSAHYKLANYARRDRDMEKFRFHMREFTRLKKVFGDNGGAESLLEACRYMVVELGAGGATTAQPPIGSEKPAPVSFTKEVLKIESVNGLAVLEAHPDGTYEVVLVTDKGDLDIRSGKDLSKGRTLEGVVPPGFGLRASVVGDFHDAVPDGEKYNPKRDRRNDLLLIGESSLALLERTADGGFENVTSRAKLAGLSADVARWVDFDHDGDLDLALGGATGLSMMQNNGDGTFQDVSATIGIPALSGVIGIDACDFEGDVAIDLLVHLADGTIRELRNDRVGSFKLGDRQYDGVMDFAINDVNNDGRMELILLKGGEVVAVALDSGVEAASISLGENPHVASRLLLFDYDNNGWLDVLLYDSKSPPAEAEKGHLVILRDAGHPTARSTEAFGHRPPGALGDARVMYALDWDVDGDSDLIGLSKQQDVELIKNEADQSGNQLRVSFESLKTNPSGFDTELQIRVGDVLAARATGATGYVEFGVGATAKLDSLRTLWGNGVVDHEIGLPVAEPVLIVEKNVAIGSCPFLYAWDGSEFQFVTDILGNSPIGLSLRRGEVLAADPDEYVYVGSSDEVGLKDGQYLFSVSEEFREVLYLDGVELVAVDHPEGVEVHTTDKLMPAPFPDSELIPLAAPLLPVLVESSDGIDRTKAMLAIDGVFAPSGSPLPPPYRGMCEPLSLTMTFDSMPTDAHRWLALTGWLQYGDASTNIALSQQRAYPVIPPTFEARVDGQWQALDVVVGMPAGKTKTILVDLNGVVPDGFDALRLTTTFELRWDRVALFTRYAGDAVKTTRLQPSSASLAYRGFSPLVSRAPLHPTTPIFDEALPSPPWRTTPQGWCTRYGDVMSLVAGVDGKVVVANAGDAVSLTFPAIDQAVTSGHARSFFFYSYGWEKD